MVDFEVYQGDVFRWPVEVTEDGEPLDITDYKYYMTTLCLNKTTIDTAFYINLLIVS